ncbi:D-Ala-D-Ala carboxypeptidase family metallohydrolase [Phytohabitans rumicis]|uniref:Uncharacterized protein n=1 Tax=Phytohabitans rumicis TaxID=1076125 RepID=A0A6V8KPR2_9ACTN|nr:D-Ala-D-Ala carboxypeptidase family metallohydrolase [Phytohabitans rumicis]GFJ87173.1 hypothetical protein Prum_008150 [Phytohabitans rumicis]
MLADALHRIAALAMGFTPPHHMPLRGFSAAEPSVDAVNDAKRFDPATFSPAAVHWAATDTDGAAYDSIAAMRLGLRWTARPDKTATVLPPTFGIMVCQPSGTQQRLVTYLSDGDLGRLRARPAPDGEDFPVLNARFVYAMSEPFAARFANAMRAHHEAGHLRPLVVEGLDGPRGEETYGPDVPPDFDTIEAIDSWLAGQGPVLWRFADSVRADEAGLGDLADGQTLELYAEVMGQEPGETDRSWYRVNAGFVLDRIRDPGDGLDAVYDVLTDGFRGGGVASGLAGTVTTPARADLRAVWGGSRRSLVLQPYGVVPTALFSFVTCERIHVFGPALVDAQAGPRPMHVERRQPTIARLALTQLWQRHGMDKESLVPGSGTAGEFLATDYPDQVTTTRAKPPERPSAFYDDLAREVTYGPVGRSGENVAGSGIERTLVPHELPLTRPSHPRWGVQARRRLLLRRLYPLRYHIRLGPDAGISHEFAVAQDERDCIRQEYAFHLRFTDYFQTYSWKWQGNRLAAIVLPTRRAGELHEVEYDAHQRPVRPALVSSGGLINVPRRAAIRPGQGNGAYRQTLIMAEAPERLGQARTAAGAYAAEMVSVLRALEEGTAIPPLTLPPYAVELVTKVSNLLTGPTLPLSSADGFLQAKLLAAGPVSRLATTDPDGNLVPRPYRLQISSGWRPPEHNETVSGTPLSNHQIGEAMDVQPEGAGAATTRSPLALFALHLAAQDFFAAGSLRECLLENNAEEYIVGQFEAAKSDRTVFVDELPDGRRVYVLRAANLTDEPFNDVPSHDGEPITDRTRLDVRLAEEYRTDFYQTNGPQSLPWPRPTYLDLYLYALCGASHVHHTWNP